MSPTFSFTDAWVILGMIVTYIGLMMVVAGWMNRRASEEDRARKRE